MPFSEDLGAAAAEFTLEGYLVGDDVSARRGSPPLVPALVPLTRMRVTSCGPKGYPASRMCISGPATLTKSARPDYP